jgi:hypothetical protein
MTAARRICLHYVAYPNPFFKGCAGCRRFQTPGGIEAVPAWPRYLLTEPGVGYRLVAE